jgi:hypothetical protein
VKKVGGWRLAVGGWRLAVRGPWIRYSTENSQNPYYADIRSVIRRSLGLFGMISKE